MKNFNTEKRPENEAVVGFSCELFHLPEPVQPKLNEFESLAAFEGWVERELEQLESRFAGNMTVCSLRNELLSGR